MKIAEWKEEYNSGNNIVDDQHRVLFETINNINKHMHSKELFLEFIRNNN